MTEPAQGITSRLLWLASSATLLLACGNDVVLGEQHPDTEMAASTANSATGGQVGQGQSDPQPGTSDSGKAQAQSPIGDSQTHDSMPTSGESPDPSEAEQTDTESDDGEGTDAAQPDDLMEASVVNGGSEADAQAPEPTSDGAELDTEEPDPTVTGTMQPAPEPIDSTVEEPDTQVSGDVEVDTGAEDPADGGA